MAADADKKKEQEQEKARQALYLYGFARWSQLPELPELPGVTGRDRVTRRRHRDLAAVVSEVPLDEFTGPDAEAHLSEIDWVGPRAVRHESILEEIMRRSPVFPAHFGILFSSEDRLLELMARRHDEIVSFLDRIAGREEWAVKGYLDRAKATEAVAAEAIAADEAALPEAPGKRFLRRQRALSDTSAKVTDLTEAARGRLRRELESDALPLVERTTTVAEGQREVVMNFAILVPHAEVPAALDAVGKMNAEWEPRGLTVACTGPLPPYSFTPALEQGPSSGP
jgi:hypothetical protein